MGLSLHVYINRSRLSKKLISFLYEPIEFQNTRRMVHWIFFFSHLSLTDKGFAASDLLKWISGVTFRHIAARIRAKVPFTLVTWTRADREQQGLYESDNLLYIYQHATCWEEGFILILYR